MGKLYKKISQNSGMEEKEVSAVLNSLNEIIIQDVDKQGYCKVPGLGTFSKKELKPHIICNVQTGKRELTQPSNSLSFKSTDSVKRKLNSKKSNSK